MSYPVGVKVGDILVALGAVESNIGQRFKDGTEFRVDRLDEDEDEKNCISLEIPGDYFNGGYWFYFDNWSVNWGHKDNVFTIKQGE